MRRLLFVFCLGACAAAFATPAPADDRADREQYRHCLKLARVSPDEGWEEALAWTSLGGGEPARHCAAFALIGLGKYEEAGNRLESLAQDSRRDPKVRAEMLAQAGQAWMLARNTDRAYAAESAGLKVAPDDVDLWIDRAVTLATAKNYGAALADLNQALTLWPRRVDALAYRATALRFLDRVDEAERDVAAALSIDPKYADALVERGILRRLKGDSAGARQDWLAVLQANPDSPAADTARRNLELMDVKKD